MAVACLKEAAFKQAAQLECYFVNANIAIVWMSECCLNVAACILHVIVKVFFTYVEALGDACILRLLALLFKLHQTE